MQKNALIKLLGLSLAILVVGSWLLLGLDLPGDSRVIRELQHAGHTIALLIVMLGLSLCINRYFLLHSVSQCIAISALVCVIFSVTTELVQTTIGREASWPDFFMDVLGIFAGGFIYAAIKMQAGRRIYCASAAVVIVLWAIYPPLTWSYAKKVRDDAFPLISDFENPWASRFFEGTYGGQYSVVQAPEEWKENASQVAKLEIVPGSWPGFRAFDLRGRWWHYKHLKFEVFNPADQKIKVVLRIHDNSHNNEHDDRFNKTYTVKPGQRVIRVPIKNIRKTRSGRELNLRKIRVLMVYVSRPKKNNTLYFDNFRLE